MVDSRLRHLSGSRLAAEFRRRCKRWQRWARAVHLPACSTAMASVDEVLDEYNRRARALR